MPSDDIHVVLAPPHPLRKMKVPSPYAIPLGVYGWCSLSSCSKVNASGDALFEVWVDGRPAVQTPHLHGYDRPYDISVDLTGAKMLVLHATSDGGPVAWAGAFIEVASGGLDRVRTVPAPAPVKAVIAKRNPHELRINGPRVVGATPGRPFVFKIPATGQPPLSFSARHLPVGLSLDSKTGIVTGAVEKHSQLRPLPSLEIPFD